VSLQAILILIMLKKLVNKELQSTSIIFPREEAICLKVFHLLHIGGTPLI
jgi:hypothetical protein